MAAACATAAEGRQRSLTAAAHLPRLRVLAVAALGVFIHQAAGRRLRAHHLLLGAWRGIHENAVNLTVMLHVPYMRRM